MPLTRKHQIAVVKDASPGTAGTLAASNIVDTLTAEDSSTRQLISREPGGGTLSRSVEAVGQGEASVQVECDVKGSGTSGVAPDWGPFLEGALMAQGDLAELTLDAARTSLDAVIPGGEIVTGATSGAQLLVLSHSGATDKVYGYKLDATAFQSGEALNGELLGNAFDSLAASSFENSTFGVAWTPVSEKRASFELASGHNAVTYADGLGITIVDPTAGNEVIGQAIVKEINGDVLTVDFAWGTVVANGIVRNSTNSAEDDVAAVPNLTSVSAPTITVGSIRDALSRQIQFGRANVQMQADAGAGGRWTFNVQGQGVDWENAPNLSPAPAINTSPQRMVDKSVAIDGVFLPVKSVSFDLGAQIVTIQDANAPNGERGGEITDRAASVTVEVEQTNLATLNWQTLRDTATTVNLGIAIQGEAGNRIGIAAPDAQISEISDGDVDGIATHQITFQLRRWAEGSGDDEFVIGHW